MAKQFPSLTPELKDFIGRQHMFFTASACAEGRINLSPKGLDGFRVTGDNEVVFLNLTGSGNETTILGFIPTLMHHGMVVVGAPYSIQELTDISEFRGGSAYGAGTVAGPDGSRQPSEIELTIARKQGAHVAGIAAKLVK